MSSQGVVKGEKDSVPLRKSTRKGGTRTGVMKEALRPLEIVKREWMLEVCTLERGSVQLRKRGDPYYRLAIPLRRWRVVGGGLLCNMDKGKVI